MRKLSKRLQAAYDFIPSGSVVADVGADHAQLTLALLESGKVAWAQAIENKVGPFIRMKANIDRSPFASHIDCSQSDGLDELSLNVNCLALLGMGGKLIGEILERGKEKLDLIDTIVLDPHKDLVYIREKLVELGFRIEDEEMVLESGVFYTIIKAVKGKPRKPYTKAELAFGPILLQKKGPVFLSFCEENLKAVGKNLDKGLSEERRRKYLNLYHLLKRIIAESQSEAK